ncbi:acyloxyacyl hydrolase [Parendozoicomonas haliclonae]|uniref:Lipid A deacylase PagL n=1 Tax=Parendozoicomonas haliclonae TaxID=1960125 RepID=A0A1X7AJ18_9GAMM|nr:acyloxyacyl hydrolase [Parendozoicomonas haliclonae]SMA45245.1 Lipid A deacylase PagL precursor [Parendozoicomonas haliclonae]
MAQWIRAAVITLSATLFASSSYGEWIDGIIISGGEDFASKAELRSYRISVFKEWESKWFNDGDWYVGGYFDASLNRWNSRLSKRAQISKKGEDQITAVAFSPVFRITRKSPWFGSWTPFGEAGIGLAYQSGSMLRAKDEDPVDMGMKLQFEDRIGVGFTFGSRQQYQVILRAFHYSNAGLHSENDGFNLHEIAFGYSFK